MSEHAIVGVWLAKAEKAPFKYHVITFHSDGTMVQSNPEAGNSEKSDSVGMGPWSVIDSTTVHAKFVEVSADRLSRDFVSRGEVYFEIKVDGDEFVGSAEATFFDEAGKPVKGPLVTPIKGTRVTLNQQGN